MLNNIKRSVRVVFLTVCIVLTIQQFTYPVYAYDSYITIPSTDTTGTDTLYHSRLPITRASYASILNTAKSMGYYDGTDTSLYEPVKRSVYATIFNRVAYMTSTPKLECCMGNSPDFSDLVDNMWYTEEVKKAASNGYLCTRDGTRAEDYLTFAEFNQILNKFISSMDWQTNHSTIDCQTFRDYFGVNNPELVDLPDAYIAILCNLFVNDMLPITSEGKLRLNDYVTKYDVLQWAVAYTDLKVMEYLALNDSTVCVSCVLSDIEPWYDRVDFPLH